MMTGGVTGDGGVVAACWSALACVCVPAQALVPASSFRLASLDLGSRSRFRL